MNRTTRRICALGALLCAVGALAVIVAVLWNNWAPLLGAFVLVLVALMAAWYVVTKRGVVRLLATIVAVAAVVVAFATLLRNHSIGDIVLAVVLVVAFAWLARAALAQRAVDDRRRAVARHAGRCGAASDPDHEPVVGWREGERGVRGRRPGARHRDGDARHVGDDLEQLARDAIGRGADVIGMAGGDGSQALVAGIASERDVPFVCIPAGTRNHFALDLGVDREDVVGALDAFTDGYERRVDLARVNGRVFVNNVSFGVYAAIVQSDEYRDAKLNTAAKMLPELLGSDYDPFDFELDGPPAVAGCDPDLILVSNNVYKLEGIGGLGHARARSTRACSASSWWRCTTGRSSRSSSRCRPPVGVRPTRDGTSGARPRSR